MPGTQQSTPAPSSQVSSKLNNNYVPGAVNYMNDSNRSRLAESTPLISTSSMSPHQEKLHEIVKSKV